MSKINQKIQFTANKIKGKIAEEIAKKDYQQNGFQIKETGIGSDFIVTKKFGNIRYTEYVDVKSGNAKLTKKQKLTKTILKKEKIPYSVYRVTNEHIEFQLENNSELRSYCNNMGIDISKFPGTFVIQNPTKCPNCNLDSEGLPEILTHFGLRNMGDGITRVQSWCRSCRSESREVSAQ